jgi:branched-chain amino acid transport system substrate-binding protein
MEEEETSEDGAMEEEETSEDGAMEEEETSEDGAMEEEETSEDGAMEEEETSEDGAMEEEETSEDGAMEEGMMDAEPEVVAEPPTDEMGVIEIPEGNPIVLAYALLTSGPNSNLGIDSMRGVEIAMDDIGGEILGREIQLVGEDTGCSPEGGQAAANKLISNEQIVGIVGPTCSSAGNVMAPVIDESGLVTISPSNTAPGLTDPETHVQGFLRTAHNDKVQGAIAAEFAYNELGLTNAATIHDGSVYAEQLANVFAEKFAELGGTVVTQEAINETDTDMRPVLTTIATEEPEVLYYPIFMPAGGFVTRQARDVDGLEDITLMGADGLFNPDFVDAAGDAAVGMYLSSPDLTSFGSSYQEFLDKHMEKYGEDTLSVYHANAYDATMLLLKAVQEAAVQTEDGTLYIPRQAIRDALYSTENYQGLAGSLTCDEYGDCADPKIVVYEIVDSDPDSWSPGDPAEKPEANPGRVYP